MVWKKPNHGLITLINKQKNNIQLRTELINSTRPVDYTI